MTNWMTAAGLAFIAGGLATLISFRAVLFGGGDDEGDGVGERGEQLVPPVRRRPIEPAVTEWPEQEYLEEVAPRYAPRARRSEESSRYIDTAPWRPEPEPEPADADDWILVSGNERYAAPPPPPPVHPIDRSDRGYGDRVDGWVRPDYPELDDRPPAGDYWTPVPDELYADPEPSARGYGWPTPVERLPSVPDYEPGTGFDLSPVQAAEPTTLVPDWARAQDHRIRPTRSWASRDEQGRRPRPRPRPSSIRPVVEQDSQYISRHSAGPYYQ